MLGETKRQKANKIYFQEGIHISASLHYIKLKTKTTTTNENKQKKKQQQQQTTEYNIKENYSCIKNRYINY